MRTLHKRLWWKYQINEGNHLSAFGQAGAFKRKLF